MLWGGQKVKWKEQLQEIQRKRTELLPLHQKTQKRSQKLQSLQDKKRNYLKDACACEEEIQKLREEMEERQARFRLYQRSRATVGWRQMTWKKGSRFCRQGWKEEAAVRRRQMDAALNQPWWSRSSHLNSTCRTVHSSPARRVGSEGSRFQPLLCTREEEKREEENGNRSKRKERPVNTWVHKRQVGATKALPCFGSCLAPGCTW